MNTNRLLSYFIGLSATIILFSCGDHRIPVPGSPSARLRVKTLTQVLPANARLDRPNSTTSISAFAYDAQGRLGSITTFRTPDSALATVEHSLYQYDSQNRLTQLRRVVVVRPATNDPNPTETYTYSYNASGQVSNLDYSNNRQSSPGFFNVTLQYNGANQLVGSIKTTSLTAFLYQQTNAYTFTGNNLSIINSNTKLTIQQTTFPEGNTTTTFTQDNKVNPFYGLSVIPAPFTGGLANPLGGNFNYYTYYGGVDNYLNLSINNVISSTNFNESNSYAYIYNGDNLPINRVTTRRNTTTNDILYEETLLYDYETY